jgi:hypothetical protein
VSSTVLLFKATASVADPDPVKNRPDPQHWQQLFNYEYPKD